MKTTEQILVLLILVLSLSNLYFIYVFKLQQVEAAQTKPVTEMKVIYVDRPAEEVPDVANVGDEGEVETL